MKTVILGAGMGSRLKKMTPKPLVILKNDKNILDYQLEKILKLSDNNDIIVVVGYKKEEITNKYPQLTYVFNERYSQTNTGKSLLLALESTEPQDILWINGDIFFEEGILPKLLEVNNSCVLVDQKKCSDEEVRYDLDDQGYIKNISKVVEKGVGEALGINFIKKEDFSTFKKHLDLINDNDYFEKALENMIRADGVKVLPVSVGDLFCQEIDFPSDLENVQKYLFKG